MIRNDKELIKETKRYFGKDRSLLKQTVKNLDPSDSDLKQWKTFFEKYYPKKFDINERMFKDFADLLFSKKYDKIVWDWIGDLSWDVDIILNREVNSSFDFDKKLAAKCKNNTVRFLNIYISDIIPAYSICTFFKKYHDNVYEFGPLKLSEAEKHLINKIKSELRKKGYYYVKKQVALKKFKDLRSDLNTDGNASIFDCLFNDMDNYTDEYFRCNDEDIVDSFGRKTLWREYFDSRRKLKKREDSRWFNSGDLEQVITNGKGQIIEVNIYPKESKPRSIQLNIEKTKKKYKNKYSVYLP